MNTGPDGACHAWSHWDEGGKKFGVYKDVDVIANTNAHPDSLKVKDKARRNWELEVDYVHPRNNEFDFVPKRITGADMDIMARSHLILAPRRYRV